MTISTRLTLFLALLTLVATGCDSGDSGSGPAVAYAKTGASQANPSVPDAPSATPPPGSSPQSRAFSTDALLFAGGGTWSSEVGSLETILTAHGATYAKVSSAQLDAMSVDELAKFGVLIFPGGAGGTEASSLGVETHARIREAVQSRGVSYVGFCAGSFIAVAPAPTAGHDVSYGLGVVAGPELEYYFLENQGTDIAMTLQTFADGTSADILWYGGPVTPNIPGGVVAKYPDGNPSISEMWSGAGFVVLSGGHPTADAGILSSLGMNSTDGVHTEIAWNLITAAIHAQPLPAF